jgi:hypothetical protein
VQHHDLHWNFRKKLERIFPHAMKKEKNQYMLLCLNKTRKDLSSCYEERKESIHAFVFEGQNQVYGLNLLLKRSLWSRFTHHQIDRYYGVLLMTVFRIEKMRSPPIRSGPYSK